MGSRRVEGKREGGSALARRYRLRGRLVLAATLLGALALAFGLQHVAGRNALTDVRASAEEALALQSETVSGTLEKYRFLPPLLSRRADVAALFDQPWLTANREAARAKAVEIAGYSGAKDVVFADSEGRIFASARGLFDSSPLQETTLFEAAAQGRLGRETMSVKESERSYVFASAIRREGGPVTGVIAVYVRFDRIEATWSLSANPILVTGKDGVIFLGNREEWQLRHLTGSGDPILTASGGEAKDIYRRTDGRQVVMRVKDLPLLGWRLHALSDMAPVEAARRSAAIIGLLLAAIFGITGWFMVQRRLALEMRLRRDKASALRLERQVRDRTAALSATNVSLAREVEERARTEERLRSTQKELVQSAKLAALGQMSATLSHEYNQPLAAIRTYSDNALLFLERGKPDSAGEALTRIGGLVDRMSELSRTLLGFARKPGTAITPVHVWAVVDEALLLAGPRAKKAGVTIEKQAGGQEITAAGGRVRLTQVVVNLVNNAVDALTGVGATAAIADPLVRIGVAEDGDGVLLVVEDNGPGIAQGDRERIFEPFFSTKGVGEGIGIGLSIVYTILTDMGATIRAGESSLGGARFEVLLKQAAKTGTDG
ncbi:MAG: sensor histidine kinase [Notoacmeibacter sp.]|nr:sensor histidine kinase [Notoacmeibacter sp.]